MKKKIIVLFLISNIANAGLYLDLGVGATQSNFKGSNSSQSNLGGSASLRVGYMRDDVFSIGFCSYASGAELSIGEFFYGSGGIYGLYRFNEKFRSFIELHFTGDMELEEDFTYGKYQEFRGAFRLGGGYEFKKWLTLDLSYYQANYRKFQSTNLAFTDKAKFHNILLHLTFSTDLVF